MPLCSTEAAGGISIFTSRLTAHGRQVGNQIVEFRGREELFVGRHGRLVAQLLEIAQIGFAEAQELAGGGPDLDGEAVFIDADAFDLLTLGGDCVDKKEGLRQVGRGVGDGGFDMRGAALQGDPGQLRAEGVAGAGEDMAAGAGSLA